MNWPMASVLAAWLVLNLLASAAVLRNPLLPASKRLIQLALVWLLPVVGAVVCLVFVSSATADGVPTSGRTAFGDGADGSVAPVEISMDPGGCSGGGGDGD